MSRRTAVVWWVILALLLASLVVGYFRSPEDDAGASAYDSQEVDVSHLEVGDCVHDFVTTGEVTRLPEVPCDQPHKGEVVGRFPPAGPFPGDGAVPDGVQERCRELFAAYAPVHAADRGFYASFSLASRRQWSDPNYRFTCVATDLTFRTGRLTDQASATTR